MSSITHQNNFKVMTSPEAGRLRQALTPFGVELLSRSAGVEYPLGIGVAVGITAYAYDTGIHKAKVERVFHLPTMSGREIPQWFWDREGKKSVSFTPKSAYETGAIGETHCFSNWEEIVVTYNGVTATFVGRVWTDDLSITGWGQAGIW